MVSQRVCSDLAGLFSAIDLASLAWSMAILQWQDTPLLESLSAAAVEGGERFPVQALANLVWCLATLRGDAPELLQMVSSKRIPELRP